MIRAKCKWTAQAETNASYFFNLGKNRAMSRTMQRTYKNDGIFTSNTKEILQIQAQFYENLFRSDTNVKCKFDFPPAKKLTEEQKEYI